MVNSRSINVNSSRISSPIWISLIVLLLGLIVTFCFSNYFYQEEETQSKKDFIQVCNEIRSKIITRINIQTEFLISGSSFFEASKTVTREEWKSFNKFSTDNVKFIGVQGLGFSTVIKRKQLEKHILAIRKEGFPEYKIFPEGERTAYTSIIYIEPHDRNKAAFGYDMFSDSVRRQAMEMARDRNKPVLSGKVFLRQETNKNIQAGTLLYVPVYDEVSVNTIEARRDAIVGWVFSAFRMDDLMNSILGNVHIRNKANIGLQIYDNGSVQQKALLFDSHKSQKIEDQAKISTRTIPVFLNNRKWTLVFSQSSENAFFSTKIVFISIGGIVISLLLSALSYSLLITKQRAKSIAERLSYDLSVKNQEYESINKTLHKNYKKLISSREKLKKANDQLEKALMKAKESDQLKSAFLANMSHEIRTPMNGIMGFTELLKETDFSSEEHQNYIEIIEKSGTRLLNIINDIVDVSKIEAGQMNVSLSATNIDEQMQYIQTFFKPETHDKGIELVVKSYSNMQQTVITTDKEKLYAILLNLVKNAIKYTVRGTIEFGYEIKGDFIEFFVKDTGIGISKDRQKAIFERFIQADFNDKMARQGAGLGLSIAKAYVELLGGKIWVESELQKGSTFYFTLPNHAASKLVDESQKGLAVPPDDWQFQKLKILVTEDDAISKMLILKAVEPFSKEILTAQTGLEAIELCHNHPDIDLILMDIQMPQMNGYEAIKEIRKFNKKVIILAQTAFALEGDKEKTIAAGCNGYISKPIKKQELAIMIQHYFGNRPSLN
ncbi:CHASE domain-containing protein [Flavobacterium eburneipallidum]|uniref:CHASE domain-containing protein n=1 Tax=Flavobacterium eburneipallidum TaxID=3003263 RepID=UPI0024832CC8|nr:CHASE domain-containing protein [Flavobacterium eburneipallidum]